MDIWEIIILSVALAMDACAVAMTNGMCQPKMKLKNTLLIGGFFGFFQFLMPLIGFYITGIVANAFLETFQNISSWVSFILLAFLGGRMIFESVKDWQEAKKHPEAHAVKCDVKGELTMGQLFMQAIATSIDALAVGVTLQMASISPIGLALGPWGATLMIGVITFALSVGAVYIGKAMGDKLADKASFGGGLVLVLIGLKILLDGIL